MKTYITRKSQIETYADKGIHGDALSFLLKAGGSERHESRKTYLEQILAQLDGDFAHQLVVVELMGCGGEASKYEGDSTLRLPIFRTLGKGRKHASDGEVWTRLLTEWLDAATSKVEIDVDTLESKEIPSGWRVKQAQAALLYFSGKMSEKPYVSGVEVTYLDGLEVWVKYYNQLSLEGRLEKEIFDFRMSCNDQTDPNDERAFRKYQEIFGGEEPKAPEGLTVEQRVEWYSQRLTEVQNRWRSDVTVEKAYDEDGNYVASVMIQ